FKQVAMAHRVGGDVVLLTCGTSVRTESVNYSHSFPVPGEAFADARGLCPGAAARFRPGIRGHDAGRGRNRPNFRQMRDRPSLSLRAIPGPLAAGPGMRCAPCVWGTDAKRRRPESAG